MYTYTFGNGVKAELESLDRDCGTGVIQNLTWHCYANGILYGTIWVAQRAVSKEFYVLKQSREDTSSWLQAHTLGLLAHCTEHFADTKSQGEFFQREPGTLVDGASEWEV